MAMKMANYYDLPLEVMKVADKIMDGFDWHKVKLTMDHLEWKWVGVDTYDNIPEISDMKRVVRMLCADAYFGYFEQDSKFCTIGTGGFEVTYFPPQDEYDMTFEIKFVVASWGNI